MILSGFVVGWLLACGVYFMDLMLIVGYLLVCVLVIVLVLNMLGFFCLFDLFRLSVTVVIFVCLWCWLAGCEFCFVCFG